MPLCQICLFAMPFSLSLLPNTSRCDGLAGRPGCSNWGAFWRGEVHLSATMPGEASWPLHSPDLGFCHWCTREHQQPHSGKLTQRTAQPFPICAFFTRFALQTCGRLPQGWLRPPPYYRAWKVQAGDSWDAISSPTIVQSWPAATSSLLATERSNQWQSKWTINQDNGLALEMHLLNSVPLFGPNKLGPRVCQALSPCGPDSARCKFLGAALLFAGETIEWPLCLATRTSSRLTRETRD